MLSREGGETGRKRNAETNDILIISLSFQLGVQRYYVFFNKLDINFAENVLLIQVANNYSNLESFRIFEKFKINHLSK